MKLKLLVYTLIMTLLLPLISRGQGFKIDGTNLQDACGNNFVMRGINVPLVWFVNQTLNNIGNIRSNTNANALRLVVGNGYSPNDGTGDNWNMNDANWQQATELCIDNDMIPMLEVHNILGSNDPADLQAVADWWANQAGFLTQEGIEEYVLINIANEWGSWQMANADQATWRDSYIDAIQTIRDAGITTTIVVDAPNYGQDIEASTILNFAQEVLDADPESNVLFSVHMYCQWAENGDSAPDDELLQIQNSGLPIMIGEFGPEHDCGATINEDLIINTTADNDIGWFAWSWTGNSNDLSFLDMSDNWEGTQLTSWGQTVVNHQYGTDASSMASVFDGSCDPTPVQLANFSASPEKDVVKLNWNTTSETGNSHFEVERSNDARNFHTIGTVQGAGNSQQANQYGFTDNNPAFGTNYYRLTQYDFDGDTSRSRIVPATFEGELKLNAWPNPFTNQVSITSSEQKSISLRVTNMKGKTVARASIGKEETIHIGENLNPGIYFIHANTRGKKQVRKVVKY